MQPDIHRLLEFQKLLSDFNQVERVVHRKHLGTFVTENDIEHSYTLAMTAWYLSKWFPELDQHKLITYGLVHDLVEVHAGDTYIYGTHDELDTKEVREEAALKQLEKEWVDFPEMTQAIREYEKLNDGESQFIYALDKVMPIMQIYINDGYSWKKGKVTTKMLYEAKMKKFSKADVSKILPYFDQLYALLLERPDLIKKS